MSEASDSDSGSGSSASHSSPSRSPSLAQEVAYPPYNPPPEDDEDEDDDDDDSSDSDSASASASPPPAPAAVPMQVVEERVTEAPVPVYNFSDQNPRPVLGPAQAQGLMRILVASELRRAGFDSADEEALHGLVGAVDELLEQLMLQSMLLAEHARRSKPNARDVLSACQSGGIGGVPALFAAIEATQDRAENPPPVVIRYQQRVEEVPIPHLDSDPESEPEQALPGAAPKLHRYSSKRVKASHSAPYLPPLPPQHSWQHTPVYPLSNLSSAAPPPPPIPLQSPSPAALAHLSTLRARLANSALVASSLRNLMRQTSVRALSRRANPDLALTLDGVELDMEGDVVDYEGEWYGRGSGSTVKGGGKRSVRVLRVGEELEEEEGEAVDGKRGGPKRRRWRV